jgi:hypothetical protein
VPIYFRRTASTSTLIRDRQDATRRTSAA